MPSPPHSSTLGKPITKYGSQFLSWREGLIIGFWGMLAIALPLFFGFWQIQYTLRYSVSPSLIVWKQPWILLASIAAFFLALFLVYRLVVSQNYVVVHRKGLRARLGLFNMQSWLWKDLTGISNSIIQERFLHIPIQTLYYVTFYPKKGKPVKLPYYLKELPKLVKQVKDYLYPVIKPDLQAQFQSGKWLQFGLIRIHHRGIHLPPGNSRPLLWEHLDNISVQSGYLVVKPKGLKTKRYPVSKIPNLEILLELIHQGVQ